MGLKNRSSFSAEMVGYQHTYFDLYGVLGGYIIFSGVVVLILALLSIVLAFVPQRASGELGSPYECGFLPFDRARSRFDVNFFVVGLLFLLFDLEVVFILPWGLTLTAIPLIGFGGGVLFFLLLAVAFFYELSVDALVV